MTRKRPSPAGALLTATLLLLSSCAPAAQGPTGAEAENELAMRTLLQMLESGDASGVAGLFHPDATYDDYANQAEYQGLQEIAGYLSQGTRWADGVNLSITSLQASSWGAVAEWVFSGIQVRPMGSLVSVATGRDVVLNGVTLIEMDRGRIRRAADYTDALALVLQLGAEARMPGGAVLKLDATDTPSDDAPPTDPEPEDIP